MPLFSKEYRQQNSSQRDFYTMSCKELRRFTLEKTSLGGALILVLKYGKGHVVPSFPFPKLTRPPTPPASPVTRRPRKQERKKRREPVLGWSLWQQRQGIQLSLSQRLTHVIILSCRLNAVLTAAQQGLVEQGRGGSCGPQAPPTRCCSAQACSPSSLRSSYP